MIGFRIEQDSLGELQVPADALYGAQTQRAVQNFPVSGMRCYPAFIWAMTAIKRAAAEVNHDLGLFTDKVVNSQTITGDQIARAVMQAADEVLAGQWHDQFVVDPFQAGAGTSQNMNTNEVIANRANQLLGFDIASVDKPVHPNDHVNMAQSTNDTIPTAIRLGVLWRLDELIDSLHGLRAAMNNKAAEFDNVVKSGRTHLQDAVPIRLGQEFSGYAMQLQRGMEAITDSLVRLRELALLAKSRSIALTVDAEEAERLGGETMALDIAPPHKGRHALTRRFPVGPVAGISPFNFPLNLAAHKVAPALAATTSAACWLAKVARMYWPVELTQLRSSTKAAMRSR